MKWRVKQNLPSPLFLRIQESDRIFQPANPIPWLKCLLLMFRASAWRSRSILKGAQIPMIPNSRSSISARRARPVTCRVRWCILSPMSHLSRSRRSPVPIALVMLLTPLASTHLSAQWLKTSTAGVPRKPDGKVNMTAPAPRLADGKPDFSGIWTTAEPNGRNAALSSPKQGTSPKQVQNPEDEQSPSDATASRQMANIGIDLPGGLPYQPWLVPIVKERTDNLAKDDPHIKCLPDNFIRAYWTAAFAEVRTLAESFGGAQ